MEMIPVESSNVAAIGYHAECRLLRVRFRDGSLYDFPGVSDLVYASIMQAPSKGSAVGALKGRGVAIEPPTQKPYTIKLREPAPVAAGPLDTYDPDPCCGKRIAKMLHDGKMCSADAWVCPECGEVWEAAAVGPLRHWSPKPMLEML